LLAEDGGIFYTDALNRPLLDTIARPYEGYLHVVPRLLAEVAEPFPVAWAAVLLNVGAALVVAALARYVWSAAAGVLPSRWGRGLLVTTMIVLPAAGFEVNASVNNLHWYLDFACFWVFLAPERNRRMVLAGSLVAAAAALSDPLTVLLVPLAVYRLWRGWRPPRNVRALIVPLVFGVCLAVQLLYGVAERAPQSFVEVDPRDLPGTYGLRVAGSLLIGDQFLPDLFRRYGLVVAYGCLAVALAAVTAALLALRGRRRLAAGVVFVYSAGYLAIPLLIRGTSIFLNRQRVTLEGSRYMLVPALLLLAGVLIAVFDPAARPRRVLPVALTVLLGTVLALSFRMDSIRSGGPDWPDGVRAAQQRCLHSGGDEPGSGTSARNPWATTVGPGQVVIPGAPGFRGVSSWNVVVNCSRLG
jgi:hypothetical protein